MLAALADADHTNALLAAPLALAPAPSPPAPSEPPAQPASTAVRVALDAAAEQHAVSAAAADAQVLAAKDAATSRAKLLLSRGYRVEAAAELARAPPPPPCRHVVSVQGRVMVDRYTLDTPSTAIVARGLLSLLLMRPCLHGLLRFRVVSSVRRP